MNPTARWLLAALLFASPAIVAFALFAAAGMLPAEDALVAAILVTVAIGLIARPVVVGIGQLRIAIDAMAEDEEARPEVESASPLIRDLWRAIARWVRASRQKAKEREAQIDTAQLVLALLPDPLLLLDERRRIVRANEAAAQLLGNRLVERDLAVALRQPALLAAVDAVLRGEGSRVVDFDLSAPAERHFSARVVPLVPRTADSAAAISLHDLTVLKRSERLRADFAANASHELRTPLASLIGFIETLRGPAKEDIAAHERFLAIMAEQSSRMARLVEDLLSLSKIEMNEHHTPTDRVDVARVLEMVAHGLEQRAASRGMAIKLVLPEGELPPVVGDADELAQVFQNLIDNAVKYARPETEIEVVVAPSAKILPGARPGERPAALSVAVRDRGEGISREHLGRLTERFYRVDAARSRELGGTGLGLAIVKHIVNHHRGVLDIESELGQGSLFTVHLPVAAP